MSWRSLFIESAFIDYDIPILARFDTNKKRPTRLADGLRITNIMPRSHSTY